MNDYDRRMLAAVETIAESLAEIAKASRPVKVKHNPFDSTAFDGATNQIHIQTIADQIPKLIEPMSEADDNPRVAQQHELYRHVEKQDCSYRDAYRYFEREGYDMSQVESPY